MYINGFMSVRDLNYGILMPIDLNSFIKNKCEIKDY